MIQRESSPALIDRFGRVHTSLRVSVTDRCNIRCFYCMPAENVTFLPRPQILTFEELVEMVRVFAGLGINKVRLTGGEPLVRRDLPALVAGLRNIDTIRDISLTTNGMLLATHARELREAGLNRVNISLDTLDREQFRQITRRDGLADTLAGIDAALETGFDEVQLNAVAVQGMSDEQIVPLARFALERGLTLRFIEFMPLNAAGRWSGEDVLTGARIREILEAAFGRLEPVPRCDPSRPAELYRLHSGNGEFGFINSVSEPFCADCNRLRLTADGKIRNCLFSHEEWDLREPLRSGATLAELEKVIRDCVDAKRAAHGIGTADFRKPERAMYQIGG